MTRRLLVTVALIIAFGAILLSDPPPAAYHAPTLGLSQHRGIGLIQHRGQFYRFEDLMNPDYRATSNDPFVQSFAPPGQFAADPWAGLEIVD